MRTPGKTISVGRRQRCSPSAGVVRAQQQGQLLPHNAFKMKSLHVYVLILFSWKKQIKVEQAKVDARDALQTPWIGKDDLGGATLGDIEKEAEQRITNVHLGVSDTP